MLIEQSRKRNRRKFKGSSVVELVLGLSALVPILLYSIDVLLLLFSLSMTDSFVSAACRLAANGQPADLSSVHSQIPVSSNKGPYLRAGHAIESAKSSIVEIAPQFELTETINAPLPKLPRGGVVHGSVHVKMIALIHFPVPLPGIGDHLQVPIQQSLPYTWSLAPSPPPEGDGASDLSGEELAVGS